MASINFEQLEAKLRTLGETKGVLSVNKKQAIRDRVFQSIGQIELADAIATGETKASLAVSLKHLQQAMIPHRLSFSMPVTMAVVIVVFVSSIVTGAAAQSARPGDALFNVKRVLENFELAVASSPIKRAEVSLNIADQRVKDLEASVGKEAALNAVLQETQSALISAQATIQQAKDSGDEAGAAALVEKFDTLLNDQKAILDDIEKTAPSDDIKQTIVAIRDVISGKGNAIDTTASASGQTGTGTISAGIKPVAKPNNVVNQPPAPATSLMGWQTIAGRLGTSNGAPAIYFNGNQYCIISSSPVSLQEYIGTSNVAVSGIAKDGYISVYRVVVNGNVLADVPPTTGGDTLTGQAENPDQSINRE